MSAPTCAAVGDGARLDAAGEGSGTRCRAPPLSQTRLADSSGFNQRGSEYAASISRNSPSLSHTLSAQRPGWICTVALGSDTAEKA